MQAIWTTAEEVSELGHMQQRVEFGRRFSYFLSPPTTNTRMAGEKVDKKLKSIFKTKADKRKARGGAEL